MRHEDLTAYPSRGPWSNDTGNDPDDLDRQLHAGATPKSKALADCALALEEVLCEFAVHDHEPAVESPSEGADQSWIPHCIDQ